MLNFIRELIMNLFLILLIFSFVGLWLHINGIDKVKNYKKGALILDINGVVVDKPSNKNHFNINNYPFFEKYSDRFKENSLFNVVDIIRQAKQDCNITGIILDLKNFKGADQSTMQYIGKALLEFRNIGKPVIAVGNSYSQDQYYLASFANKIWLSPQGEVDLHGLAANNFYYKSLLDKLKIKTHIFRVGTYKSTVEQLTRNSMSSTARAVSNYWLNELWQSYISTIALNRNITKDQAFPGAKILLQKLNDNNGDTAKYALKNKLIDQIGNNHDIEKYLIQQFGCKKNSKSYNAISMYNYKLKKIKNININDNIAVIFANGIIVDGEEATDKVGSDTIARQIRIARLDPKVKAIILRVNSPGGSVSASEMIREELSITRKAGKPIVVSMGSIAASGGYWISTSSDYIIADPNTLTGSIGIFGIINTVEKSLNQLGIYIDGVSTSQLANISIAKDLPIEVSQMMQLSVKNGYRRFIKLVAQSRKKTPEQIDKIAQGRIWTGRSAKDNGLVDNLGDFDNAISKAIELAKLKKWNIEYYQSKSTLLDLLINNASLFTNKILYKFIQNYLPSLLINKFKTVKNEMNNLDFLNKNEGLNAVCLNCINLN